MGQGFHRLRIEGALVDGVGHVLHDLSGGSVAPLRQVVPAEDGRAVDQDDLTVGLIGGGGIEIDLAVGPEQRPGVGRTVTRTSPQEPAHLAGHLLVDRPEQVLLVPEVMVERPPGQTRPLHDLLGAGGLEAVGGEEFPRHVEERPPGVLDMGMPASRTPVPSPPLFER